MGGVKNCKKAILSAVVLAALSTSTYAADVNVLIIGSEYDSSDNYRIRGNSAAFSPTDIQTHLYNILEGAGLGTVDVSLEERYRYSGGYYSYNLASWFHWPYPEGVENTTRWPNLRGQAGTDWDYVVLIGDPYTIETMPGLYAHGVGKIAEQVRMGNAEPILLLPWPSADSTSTVEHYKEVVYRAGRSGGGKVAPGGLAWQDAGSPTGGTHPSNDGAFIAAASIYSRIWDQSASYSSYNYNDALADSVRTSVVNHAGAQQYTGAFRFQNPFLSHGDKNRNCSPRKSGGGSSTENYFVDKVASAMERAGATRGGGHRYYIGRDTGWGGNGKDYRQPAGAENWSNRRAFGYRYQTKTYDYDTHLAEIFIQDIDIADQMISESDAFRALPRRLIWASVHQADPTAAAYGGSDHISGNAVEACGSYMYTIISGRCPVDPKPNPVTETWIAHMAGYETAWRLATCQSRAPGFKVKPKSATVGFTNPEILSVEFLLPPQASVTVTISASSGDVAVSPQTLTFTPDNYNVKQQVGVLATSNAQTGATFNVNFNTNSDDEVYNSLYDVWSYTINTRPVADDQSVTAFSGVLKPITVTGSDPDGDPLSYQLVDPPTNGILDVSDAKGNVAVYLSNPGYTGPDSFTFKSNDGGDDSDPATISLTVITTSRYDFNLLNNPGAELWPFTDYDWVVAQGDWRQGTSSYEGSYSFKVAGNANAELYQDVDLSPFAARIVYGDQSFQISGYGASGNDHALVTVEYRDASGNVLWSYDSGRLATSGWGPFSVTQPAPTTANTIRVRLFAKRGGGNNHASLDAFSVVALEPSPNVDYFVDTATPTDAPTSSPYVPPPPVDAVAVTAAGESTISLSISIAKSATSPNNYTKESVPASHGESPDMEEVLGFSNGTSAWLWQGTLFLGHALAVWMLL